MLIYSINFYNITMMQVKVVGVTFVDAPEPICLCFFRGPSVVIVIPVITLQHDNGKCHCYAPGFSSFLLLVHILHL